MHRVGDIPDTNGVAGVLLNEGQRTAEGIAARRGGQD
jgi:hypothetical protein